MIEEVEESLAMKLTQPQVRVWDGLRPRLWQAVCEAQKIYLEKREQLRYPPNDPKAKGEPKLTDFDRQTMLNAQTAELLYNYELLKGYYDIIKDRIHDTPQQ